MTEEEHEVPEPAEDHDDEMSKTVMMSGLPCIPLPKPQIHLLVEITPRAPTRTIELPAGSSTIGRRKTCDIQVNDVKVSGEHCQILVHPQRVTATDLGSTNGSLVNGAPLLNVVELRPGDTLTLGSTTFLYQMRDPGEADATRELHEDLKRAAGYIQELLPEEIATPQLAIRQAYIPCELLGGDAFGHFAANDHQYCFYLLDVAGHGVEAALHASAILNTLQSRTLPDVDFANPPDVLTALNQRFHMADHAGKYLTMWMGRYDFNTRELVYAGGGHPAVLLYEADQSEARLLESTNPGIGLVEAFAYEAECTTLPAGARLLLFSDGAYECIENEDGPWAIQDFCAELAANPILIRGTPTQLHEHVCNRCHLPRLNDDFTMMAIDTP